jgi:O-antigen/teichoic acid export membrane protein
MKFFRQFANWARAHPARAAVVAGWYQQGCSTLGAIISIPLILRYLSPTDAGLWFSLQGFLLILGLADFGFSPAVSRQAAHSLHLVPGDEQRLRRPDMIDTAPGWPGVSELYGSSRVLFWRITAFAALAMILLYHAVLPLTRLIEHRSPTVTLTYYALGAAVLLNLQTRLSHSFLDGIGYMSVSRAISGTYGFLWNIASVVGLMLVPGLFSMSLGVLACALLQYWAMNLALARAAGTRIDFEAPSSKPFVRRLWKVSLPFGVVNSGVYLLGAVQVPLLGAMLGAAAVAPFYLAARIGQTLHTAVQQVTLTQMPLFTQQLAAGEIAAARRRMLKTLRIGTILYLLSGLFLYFVSPPVVRLWVGPGKYVGMEVLLLFTINFVVGGLTVVPGHFVLASGSNPFALSTLLQGLLTVIGAIFLCPSLGISGIPLSGLIAGICTNYWLNPLKAAQLWQHMDVASAGNVIENLPAAGSMDE